MMPETFSLSFWSFVSLLGLSALFAASILLLRRLTRILPATWRLKSVIATALFLGQLLLAAVWLFVLLKHLFGKSPLLEAAALVAIVLFGLWVVSETFRDILNGVAIRTSGKLRPGDRICVDGIDGCLVELGTRVMVLTSDTGDELLIPYTRVARSAIVRDELVFGAYRHTFQLPLDADIKTVQRLALTCHWANTARLPLIVRRGQELNVTVFAIDAARGGAIESYVRARIH